MKDYFSHKGKKLEEHLAGVVEKTKARTHLKIAEIAALFHDLGKINPNFQLKLDGEKNVGYSSHAYLSALAWLCFFETNKTLAKEILNGDATLRYSVATMIARHHGNLPNMEEGFLNKEESQRLKSFIQQISAEELPISNFLQLLFSHNEFPTKVDDRVLEYFLEAFPLKFKKEVQPKISDCLNFFLDTQFGFACLIESDKRDAGNNTIFKRKEISKDFKQKFSTNLAGKLQTITTDSGEETDEKKKRLDVLRSEMREKALMNLRSFLEINRQNPDNKSRVFTLSAPTGAGKTLMLLSLANEILKHDENLSVIYALPFLAITEQTEKICLSILKDDSEKVLRVDSKSENPEIARIQAILDANPSDENVKKLLQELFSNVTFDHPFIITTFVQVFETLVSNRNATLLRLPNFSKTIFLLDEIQALPPNLYTFFVAYLDEFCRKFDSYAIVSTATMPHLELPDEKHYSENQKPSKVFRRYKKPLDLLDFNFYSRPEFNRYRIEPKFGIDSIEKLADEIGRQEKSCLIVLNTVSDTKNLHKLLNGDAETQTEESEYILLNTHFTLKDRQRKLALCQNRLERKEKVILISTQLIEAGVDIDFPVLYRDLCPLPNLMQSAGRCNRNNRLDIGEVYFFEIKEGGKSSANKIYDRNFGWFLNFTKVELNQTTFEKDLLPIQQKFAKEKVSDPLIFGQYEDKGESINLVECINQMRFADFAKVKLIDADYGIEFRYYIPDSYSDEAFEDLEDLIRKGKDIALRDFEKIRLHRLSVESTLKSMSNQIVNLRLSEHQINKISHLGTNEDDKICGIRKISSSEFYSPIMGIKLGLEGGWVI